MNTPSAFRGPRGGLRIRVGASDDRVIYTTSWDRASAWWESASLRRTCSHEEWTEWTAKATPVLAIACDACPFRPGWAECTGCSERALAVGELA